MQKVYQNDRVVIKMVNLFKIEGFIVLHVNLRSISFTICPRSYSYKPNDATGKKKV